MSARILFDGSTLGGQENISASEPWDLTALCLEARELCHELRTEAAQMGVRGRPALAEQLSARADRIDQRLVAFEAEFYRLSEAGQLPSYFRRKR